MAKSKKKSSILWSVEGDFKLQASRQVSPRIPRAQFRSLSPVHSNHDSSSQASPPRPKTIFGDFATPSSGVRVSTKPRHRASSSASCDNKGVSSSGSRAGSSASTERAGSTLLSSTLLVCVSSQPLCQEVPLHNHRQFFQPLLVLLLVLSGPAR